MIKNLREYTIIGIVLISVSSFLLAEDSNITNTTTSTVTSTNTNNNTNNNTINSTSVATNNNNNVNTSTITTTATNNNTTTSTSTVTSDITQTQNVTNNTTSAITSNSTASNTNLNTNNSTNLNTNNSTSTSSVTTENVNTNTNQNTNINNNNNTSVSENSSTQKVTQRIKTAPPSAIAPSIMSYSQDLCTTGASSAVQTQFFGVSTGRSVRDENCERLKLSKGLYDMGMKVAAVSLLCADHRVFQAMEQAGSPCPYKGKIGAEAQTAWDENPEDRPDWHLIKAEMKGQEFRAYKKKDFCKKYSTHKICSP